ncbi:hypothetical protein LLH23_00720 [bacterium]|mgnify:FL=1|nr:hypothetical protein [bacterium]
MIFVLLAVFCYVCTSVSQKSAALRGLDAVGVNLVLRVSGALLTAVLVACSFDWHQPHLLPAGLIGIAGGACAFVAGYAGLRALDFGSLNATWSLLRAATVIPVLASIVFWGELRSLEPRELVTKLAGVLCLLGALVLLGGGKRG